MTLMLCHGSLFDYLGESCGTPAFLLCLCAMGGQLSWQVQSKHRVGDLIALVLVLSLLLSAICVVALVADGAFDDRPVLVVIAGVSLLINASGVAIVFLKRAQSYS